jgi:hypothetical protein
MNRSRSQAGVALILTLALVVLASFIILGLLSSMNIEREKAYSYSDQARVRAVAEAAVAAALGELIAATPGTNIAPVLVMGPGATYELVGGALITHLLQNTDNRQDNPALIDYAYEQNNLNQEGRILGRNAAYRFPNEGRFVGGWISATNAEILDFRENPRFGITNGWVSIGLGSNSFTAAGVFAGVTNRLVARYTWWIDAESCKVNVNLAGTRNPAAATSQPGDLDLRALDGILATATPGIITNLAANRPFGTVEEMRRGNAAWPAQSWDSFNSNRTYLTVYGADPNTDAFGRMRVNLNSITIADTNNSVFSDTRWATMLYSNQVTDINRNTLLKKYGRFGIAQMVANLVEYKNASGNSTAPIGSGDRDGDEIPRFYSGLKKGPMINAVIVHVATNTPASTTNTEVHCYVDVKLVNGYHDGGTRGVGWLVKTQPSSIEVKYVLPPSAVELTTNFPSASLAEKQYQLVNGMPTNSFGLLGSETGDLADMGVSPVLTSYDIILDGSSNTTNLPPQVSQVTVKLKQVRLLMTNDPSYIVDWMAPVDFSNQTAGAGFVFGAGGVTGSGIVNDPPVFNASTTNASSFMPIALVKQDPRTRTFTGWPTTSGNFASNAVNRLWENWVVYPNVDHVVRTDANSFGYDSRQSPAIYGLLADTRVRPGSTATSPSQQFFTTQIAEREFQSVGELGYIHTGYPWRTIRLRSVRPETGSNTNWTDIALTGNYRGIGDPNTLLEHIETNALPDWIMLDMFTVTNAASVAGRINLNSKFAGSASAVAPRLAPLQALLYGTSTNINSGTTLATIASNINYRVTVSNSPYASLPAYLTSGQVCETSGLGYYNDVAWHPSSADREQAIRRIANLITTRTDTFTIWAVAETIKDLDRDGRFDWIYVADRWRPSTMPGNADPTWWTNNVINSNYTVSVGVMVDGDGDGDNRNDQILGRLAVQAIVQRTLDANGKPVYRTLYTRYWSE